MQMDVNRLSTGEKIAGIAGIALILIMFIFDWYSVEASYGPFAASAGQNAWESYSLVDIILFVSALCGIALALLVATDQDIELPIPGATIVTALGGLSTLLILFRIIDKPGFDIPSGTPGISVSLSIGVFLGLISAAALTYGGYRAMQEEGTSFGDAADRLAGGRGDGPSAGPPSPPPPPPPSATPPPPPPPPSAG
jgi:hypothetical protein